MLTRTSLASLALVAVSVNATRNCSSSDASSGIHRRVPNSDKKVLIQMFGWNWKSIAAECESFLGPAGVGFVQVNPPQEHLSGDQWWVDYQAVSYQLQSRRGSRSDFAEMIGRCKNAGVKVSVGVGNAGTKFSHYDYPGSYSWNDFHHCGKTDNDDIQNWGDREQIWDCELVNLADLNTGSGYVQDKLASFTNDILALGADGLRLDAAKHMDPNDIHAIMGKLSRQPLYVSQEIVDAEGSLASMYTNIGDVQEFRYPEALKAAFTGGGIAGLRGIENRGWLASSSANVFVTNHDQERGNSALTYKSGNMYTLAHVFMLSYPYGTPTILSSYEFNDSNAGAPNGAYGTCNGASGANGWLCQHRWNAIAGMIGFYNQVGTAGLSNWAQGSNQQIAFGRGNTGFVAINNEDGQWTYTFQTSLPSGTYCDVVSGRKNGGDCTSGKVTISNGSFTVTVPGRSAVAYHIGAKN
ncbi:unnamed protein product [Rhizoctonia solani]|uniref:alpha-amylase n=1 Tax=Rhizoctonia solani TaxID=456999 RepID=A0A8H3BDC4_9AGAM|nr:unnamed protein product [Rhizoctonia solani]